MRKPHLLLSLLALAASASGSACSEDSTFTSTESIVTTAVSIHPAAFLGTASCSSEEGALRSYVVTVVDESVPTDVITLPSSPPTSCSREVSFRYILPKNIYSAKVDGYEALAEDLVPVGGFGSGSRHMTTKKTGAEVAPRWTTSCKSITALVNITLGFNECNSLTDSGNPSFTAIRVDPLAALDTLRCASAGGSVASFDLTPTGPTLPPVVGLACGSKPITYSAGIKPGELYTFRVEARAKEGGPVTWGASCFAIPVEGLVTSAVCDPLTSKGAIQVTADALLSGAGLACGDDVASYRVVVRSLDVDPAIQLDSGPIPCGEPARFAPLPAGPYSADVHAFNSGNDQVLATVCAATVTPGATVPLTCP